MKKSLEQIQVEHKVWSEKHFPMNASSGLHGAMGVCEEAGELIHVFLKEEQQIRYSPEQIEEKIKDGIADVAIYCLEICNKRGYDFLTLIQNTWEKVAARDWTQRRLDSQGVTEVEI